MTRTEIIAQLDAEINRLARARDFLTKALKGSPILLKDSLLARVTKKLPLPLPVPAKAVLVKAAPAKAATVKAPSKAKAAKAALAAKADAVLVKPDAAPAKADSVPAKVAKSRKKKTAPPVAAFAPEVVAEVTASAAIPEAKQEPQVHRVPPRRRMERRQLQSDKNKSAAALSGAVPAGPVAVSAVEARKIQERAVPAPPSQQVSELRSEIGSERSLGSLIQAFERRTGLSGLEIP